MESTEQAALTQTELISVSVKISFYAERCAGADFPVFRADGKGAPAFRTVKSAGFSPCKYGKFSL
jgi:hypothetical protein